MVWGILTQQRSWRLEHQVNELSKDVDKLESRWITETRNSAKLQANMEGVDSRLGAYDQRLQMMDAWIQTTRDKLNQQGIDPPPYSPPPP